MDKLKDIRKIAKKINLKEKDLILYGTEYAKINYKQIDPKGKLILITSINPTPYGEEYKVYLYEYVREDEISLYGFQTKEQKNMFLKLIAVKGLGCKMALPMLALGDVDSISMAIENENISYLKKFPKIGDKVARQIILDLKGKLVEKENITTKNYEELIETLKTLGYKQTDINKVLPNITEETIEKQVKEALKLLLK